MATGKQTGPDPTEDGPAEKNGPVQMSNTDRQANRQNATHNKAF